MRSNPLVTCIMITANRRHLAERAILCFKNQTYTNKTLLVIDDGSEDLTDLLEREIPHQFNYQRIEKKSGQNLGYLRNLGLSLASSELIAQWDDDDWYHPDRLNTQVNEIQKGYDACCLQATLMHLNSEKYLLHPYIGALPEGVPGTIMHKNDPTALYPLQAKGEDTTFLDHWKQKQYRILPRTYAYLFIRCFHGTNTWEQDHFTRRFRNTILSSIGYFWYKYVRQDVFLHPAFRLDPPTNKAFESYLNDSRALGLL